MGVKNDYRKNAEGYSDPTACEALRNIEQEEERFHKLLDTIFTLCELSDFHIEERIVIKDKRTGRIWRRLFMGDWQKTIDALVEAWEKFTTSIKEMVDALNKAFGVSSPEKEKKKSLSSPARYGMSLRKSRRKSFVKQYSYRPIVQKHLPYQRRNY